MSTNTIQWPPVSLSLTCDIYACEANLKPLSSSHSSLAHQMLTRPYISTWMLANLWLLNRDKPQILYWGPVTQIFGSTLWPAPFVRAEYNLHLGLVLGTKCCLARALTSQIPSFTQQLSPMESFQLPQLRIWPHIFKVLHALIKVYNKLASFSSTKWSGKSARTPSQWHTRKCCFPKGLAF